MWSPKPFSSLMVKYTFEDQIISILSRISVLQLNIISSNDPVKFGHSLYPEGQENFFLRGEMHHDIFNIILCN